MLLRWRTPVVSAVVIWFAARLLITAVAIAAHLRTDGTYFAKPGWFSSLFFHWDSLYFAGIAKNGYFSPEAHSTWVAFFPGYPAVAGGFTRLFSGAAMEGGIRLTLCIVAGLAAAASGVALWRLVEDRYGRRVALAATVLYFFGPYSVFLVASYSESLYLALGIAAWWCVSRGRWVVGGILLGFAGATRINGVFLTAALIVMLIGLLRVERRPWVARAIAFAALSLSGVAAYMLYLWARTGDLMAWSHAQTDGWHRVTTWPWRTLHSTIVAAAIEPAPDVRLQLVLDIVFAVLCCTGLVLLLLKRRWPESVLVGLTLVSLMTSASYTSLARNSITLFPLVILVASSLGSRRWRWAYWVLLAFGLALLGINTWLFTLGAWAD